MRPIRTSARGREAPPSPIRKLVPLAEAARARGVRVNALNIGQPDLPTPPEMWEAVRGSHPPVLAYSHSAGHIELREALAGYYARHSIDLGVPDLLVTAGGSEAILFALASMTDPGDQVLIPEPLYANYLGFARLLDVEVVPIPTQAENGYHLPPRAAFEERMTSRTRAILVSNPGNPTGAVYQPHEIETLLELALEWGLFIIADEVYREFCYDGRTTRSLLSYPEAADRVVLVDSISKRFSACGARIGCLGTKNREILAASLCWAQARLSPPSLGQMMARAAMELPASYYVALREEYENRRDATMEEIDRLDGVLCRRPQGAFYVMPTLPVDDAETFARWLLTDFSSGGETTFVAPGNGFYASPGGGAREVRLAYIVCAEDVRRAIRILGEGLAAYPGRVPAAGAVAAAR